MRPRTPASVTGLLCCVNNVGSMAYSQHRNTSQALHTKGQLVVLRASVVDSLPDHLANDDMDGEHWSIRGNLAGTYLMI